MKFSITAALLLLPASILAVPAAESSSEQCQVIKAISCKVINISAGTTANCRTGPGTDYPVAKKVDAGSKHAFSCYKKGECVDGNWCVRIMPSMWIRWLTLSAALGISYTTMADPAFSVDP